MYNKYELECQDCKDKITVVYDSRERTDGEYIFKPRPICSCGKLHAQADSFGFQYARDGNPKVIYHESKLLKEDYFIFDDEISEMYGIIRDRSERFGFKEYNSVRQLDNMEVCSYLGLEKSDYLDNGELIEIKIHFSLESDNGWTESERIKKRKDIISRLKSFADFLNAAEKNQNILLDSKYLWETNEFDFNGNREQLKLYDYEFKF